MTNLVNFDQAKWNVGWYAQASDEERALFKEWLRGIIRGERVNICFTKVDGSERWLHCSLHPELIPAEKLQKEEANPRKRSEDALVVWDIDKQDWRSFRYDSIKEFSFNLGDLHP